MNRLSIATLTQAAADVGRPAYNPQSLSLGIVHFGPGAFHRAHQAAYLDQLLASDPRWGICGVSLRSAGVRDALMLQDGLYTLAILDSEISYRIIASLREILVAAEQADTVLDRLLHARIVTSTVTEKGYCLTPDGTLDLTHPDIVHDLAHPTDPNSFPGYVVASLRLRHAAGLDPFVLIPCDNLPDNGHLLKAAVIALAAQSDPELALWIGDKLVCPCTMVDSITPASDDALRARVVAATGLEDRWPIQREAFTQWVIEDHVHVGGPDWASVGVIITDNVAAYERAKLRLLNGAHSTLAYLGVLRGYTTVTDAMADNDLSDFIRRLMIDDIVPLLTAPRGLDLAAYAEAILTRFRNPAIRHLLSQIAWDGSQKLPIRILSSLREALALGRDIARLAVPLAAWMHFVRDRALAGEPITDPMATELLAIGAATTGTAEDVAAFLALDAVFPPDLANDPRVVAAIEQAYAGLINGC